MKNKDYELCLTRKQKRLKSLSPRPKQTCRKNYNEHLGDGHVVTPSNSREEERAIEGVHGQTTGQTAKTTRYQPTMLLNQSL